MNIRCVHICRLGFILFFLLLLWESSMAQKKRPQLNAFRTAQDIKIDGVLDESDWKDAEIATDFTQNSPKPDSKPTFKTEVRLMYDDKAIYIGAFMHDTQPDSILRQLATRDNDANADFFEVQIDPYNRGLNSFNFQVSAAGVQRDIRVSQVNRDVNWNAVWASEAVINEKGWVVEMRIPYSAIRFPKKAEQVWGINFVRRIRRIREWSTWKKNDPAISENILQMGEVRNLKNIEAPPRLAFFPYVSGYVEHYPQDSEEISDVSTSFNGGMDVKFGLNDAFTVDMTLVPDFGQVQSDNLVLNLSPFEVQFNENRQFFTEGTDIFNKGNWFYSRRIGGRPIGFFDAYGQVDSTEYISRNPGQSQLLNATKVSGRTSSALGIGVFNGITKETRATVTDAEGETREIVTDPLTNYNVFVLDQSLKNNSYVTLVNTNVMRDGAYYDANHTGGLFSFTDSSSTWNVQGSAALSQKYGDLFEKPELGTSYSVNAGKVSGNLTFVAGYNQQDDVYDPNDLGFNLVNNQQEIWSFVGYNTYKPFWKIQRTWSGLNLNYSRLYRPNRFSGMNVNVNAGVSWINFLATGLWFDAQPLETFDYFEPRVPGRYFRFPKAWASGGWLSSDYRKPIAYDFRFGGGNMDAKGWYHYNWNFSPRFRIGDRVMLIPSVANYLQFDAQAAALRNDNGSGTVIDDEVIFGVRDELVWENVITASYIFTNRMGLSFRLRHYWAAIAYERFQVLNEDGTLGDEVTGLSTSDYDNSFDAFNIDMVYRWVFSPGSEITIVWKNSIFRYSDAPQTNYLSNLQDTWESPQTNSISLKLLYYIDYQMLKRSNAQ